MSIPSGTKRHCSFSERITHTFRDRKELKRESQVPEPTVQTQLSREEKKTLRTENLLQQKDGKWVWIKTVTEEIRVKYFHPRYMSRCRRRAEVQTVQLRDPQRLCGLRNSGQPFPDPCLDEICPSRTRIQMRHTSSIDCSEVRPDSPRTL